MVAPAGAGAVLAGQPLPHRRARPPPVAGPAAALLAAPWLARRLDVPRWAEQVSPVPGALLALAAVAGIAFGHRLFAGRPAAPTLLSLLLVAALYAAGSAAIRRAYDVAPLARHLAAVERQGRPIGYAGIYHGQFHFLGRLQRPFDQIPPGAEWHWLAEHPQGKVVQDVRELPAAVTRPDFIQPYRADSLAVWGRGSS